MAPTGSGKGSLVAHARAVFPQVTSTVSCTTRSPRPGEVEGIDYSFISREEFTNRVAEGFFVEWAEYGGNLYGTPVSELTLRLSRGEVIISEIEIQGVRALREIVSKDQRTVVYIDAGGWETLKRRARARAPISEEELALRHERYMHEIEFCTDIADIVISNQDGEIEEAKAQFEKLVGDIITKQS